MRAQSAATRGRVHLEDRREHRARAVSRGGRARLLDLRLLGLSRAPAVTSEDRGETGELGAFDQVEGGGEDALGAVEARVPREAVDVHADSSSSRATQPCGPSLASSDAASASWPRARRSSTSSLSGMRANAPSWSFW